MNKFVARLLPIFAALALALSGAGCSQKAKSGRHLSQANKHFSAGDYDKAEVEYKNAFQADPTNAAAIGRLGEIYHDQGRVAQAFGFLQRATELDPKNIEARFKLGLLQVSTGRADDARESARFVLTHNPQHHEAPVLLAETCASPEDIAAARQFFAGLPAPAPASAPVLVALGILELRSGKPAEAKAQFQQAKVTDPKLSSAHAALARIHLMDRDVAQAEQALQEAAQLSPLRSSTRIQYAQFLVQAGKPEAAKKVLEDLTRQAPDFLPAWIQLAEIAASQQRFDEAIAHTDRVLARYSASPEAMLISARARLVKGENEKAITMLESAVSRYPQAAQLHLHLGLAHAAAGDLPKATASLSHAITLAPSFVPAALALAEVEMRRGNVLLAITSLQKIVQQNPTMPEAQLLLAQAYRAQGNLEEALKIFRNVDANQTRNPLPILQAGMILIQLERKTEARQAFTRALTLAPGYIPAIEQLTNLDLADKDLAGARSRLDAELAKAPESAPLHMLLARVNTAANDMAGAETALKKVIELAPDFSLAYGQLAQLYLATKQEDKALSNLQSILDKNPKDTGAAMLLGGLQEHRRDFAGARATYEKIIAANPNAGAAYNNVAYLYAEYLGEPQKAFDAAQKARALLPNNPSVADTVGWSLFKQGQYARAVPYLQEAVEKLPDAAEAHFHLGMTRYMLGDEPAARTSLERALQIDPKFPAADLARERVALLTLDMKGSSAMSEVEKALKRDKTDPIALARAGILHEQAGRLPEALASFEAILKVSPNNLVATLKTVQLYEARKETAKAFELAKAARNTFPTNPEVAHALGRLAYQSGDHRWATSLLQDAARTENQNSDLLLDLASASYAVGNASAAESALRRAIEINPSGPRVAAARSFLELHSFSSNPSDTSPALRMAEERLKADPSDLPAKYAMGVMAERKQDIAGARKQYESALKLYPEFALAQKRLAVMYSSDPAQAQRTHELATKAREAYPNDAEVAKALGIAAFRLKNHSRAVNLLDEAQRQRSSDPEIYFYLGSAQLELKRTSEGKKSLERAVELGLKADLAAEAKKLLVTG